MFAVLWGTIFPIISEYFQNEKRTVSAPFYNKVEVPIGLFLLFLTGVGPLLAWRKTSVQSLEKKFHDADPRVGCGWNLIFDFWHAQFLFLHVSGPVRVCGLHDSG